MLTSPLVPAGRQKVVLVLGLVPILIFHHRLGVHARSAAVSTMTGRRIKTNQPGYYIQEQVSCVGMMLTGRLLAHRGAPGLLGAWEE